MVRWVFLASGHLFVALGVVGVFLPLIPTTPFLLVAAFCYSRGSRKFEHWLIHHPRLGPPVVQWREHGVISLRAKRISTALIVASGVIMYLVAETPLWVLLCAWGVLVGVLGFILSRPSQPRSDPPEESGTGEVRSPPV